MIEPGDGRRFGTAGPWGWLFGWPLAAGLAVVMFAMAFRGPLSYLKSLGVSDGIALVKDWMYYNVTVLAANYFDSGFVRRGLGGTISRLFADDPYVGALAFHILSLLLLLLAIVFVQTRWLRGLPLLVVLFMGLFLALSPQTFVGWSYDVGRTDVFAIAAVAWAALLMREGRPFIAAAVLLVASLVHETAVIFGVPLLVALATVRRPVLNFDTHRHVKALAALAGGLLSVMVVQWLSSPGIDEWSAALRDSVPEPLTPWHADVRDCAIYMTVTGLRGLRTAICYNDFAEQYALMVVASLIVLAFSAVALGLERRWLALLLAVFIPVLFMNLIANDTGRWVKFGVMNAWLLSAACQETGIVRLGTRRVVLGVALLALLISLGSSRVHEVNEFSNTVARRLGIREKPEIGEWMGHCDPDWRAIVFPRAP